MIAVLRALCLAAGVLLLAPGLLYATEGPAILLAGKYHPGIDVRRYLVSEKLDGVRAIWDGERLTFRSGKPVNAPRWFIDGLPKQALDGELWLGRGQFERLSGIVRREVPDEAAWREVRYMLFELPGAPGTFSERVAAMRKLAAAAGQPWLQVIEQERVASEAALQRRFKAVVAAGGEGLMLHLADAPYETGRGNTLLKMKPQDDAEGVVVGYVAGKGKYAGQTGALLLRLDDGRQLRLGSGMPDKVRQHPPALGTKVTFRYRDLTASGVPRFATYLRVREE